MAISSPLNPSNIVRERSTTALAAQNFISGGSPLGSSVVSSAANKIVGFYRGAAGVAPQVPDLGSIIQTLSSNILNNVETKVQSINQNVTQIVGSRLDRLEKGFGDKVEKIDATTPNRILEKFLSLYDKAIGYINFFANPSNVKRLGENLESLQKIFSETFEVAKNIRRTIIRVVNQLSNLPTASSGGGSGLNLDVKVPGAGLRRSAPSGIMRSMRRRPGMMLGGAALAGAGGAQVVSALAQPSGEIQTLASGGDGIPTPLLERFSIILDRFDSALRSLKPKEQKRTSSGGSTGTSTQPKENTTGGPGGGGGGGAGAGTSGGPADFSGSANAQKAFNYFISQGYTKEQSAGIVGNLMQENRALDPNVSNKKGHKGIAQWDPKIRYPGLVKFAKSKGLDPNTLEAQLQYFEQEMVTGSGGLSKKRFLSEAKTVEQSAVLMRTGFFRPGEHEAMDANRIKFGQQVLQKYGGNVKTGVAGKPGEKGTPGKPGVDGKPGQVSAVAVAPAPQQAQVQQQVAQQVAQPAFVMQSPQVNILPMSGSGSKPQSQGSPILPMEKMGGQQVPLLLSTNTDNFLTLYSKMVYNIVDG